MIRTITLAAVAALAAPTLALAQTATLSPGQKMRGTLSATDPKLDDDSHYRCYRMQTQAGQRYRVELTSDDFDAYLAVGKGASCAEMEPAETDDDGAGGTNARVDFTGDGQTWWVRANTLSEGETGLFIISTELRAPPPPLRVLSLALGSSARERLTDGDAQADDGSYFDCYAFNINGRRSIVARMESDDFDAFLSLYRGGRCEGEPLETDDDGGGDTDAELTATLGAPGAYSLRANSLSSGETGAYAVTLRDAGSAPPQAVRPNRSPAVTPISIGQSLQGSLSEGDAVAGDDSLYDCYSFSLRQGQSATIRMSSNEFDTYLSVFPGGTCEGEEIESDDDGADDGTNSLLTLSNPGAGTYSVRANSLGEGETGDYVLQLTSGAGGASQVATDAQAGLNTFLGEDRVRVRGAWSGPFASLRDTQTCAYAPGWRQMRQYVGRQDAQNRAVMMDGEQKTLQQAGLTYAEGRPWFVNNDKLRINGFTYVRYGLPRVLGFGEISYHAEHDGVLVAAETGWRTNGFNEDPRRPDVVYVLVRPINCEFQPYQVEETS